MRSLILVVLISMVVAAEAADLKFAQKEGFSFAESTLELKGSPFRIWIYAPLDDSPGKSCVIVPPAGTPMVFGMDLSEGDMPEHIPYAKSGHFVISFDILGAKPETETAAEVGAAINKFFAAGAGVDQIPVIMAFIAAQLKNVDPKAIYLAGHSSAGTLALQASQKIEGLAGAIAYCPITDLESRFEPEMQAALKKMVPSLKNGLAPFNPSVGYKDTKCKLMLFGSSGDTNARLSDIELFAAKLTTAKLDVVLVKGDLDHYKSMTDQGIPAALIWLKP